MIYPEASLVGPCGSTYLIPSHLLARGYDIVLDLHDHRASTPGQKSDPDKSRFPSRIDTGDKVAQWVASIIDSPSYGKPADGGGFYLFGTYDDVEGVVVIQRYDRWFIATGFPLPAVRWRSWKEYS